MRHRRRRVFIDTHKGRVSAGFTVAAEADAADVSMRLRERGWIAYRLRLEAEQYAWIATVIDWACSAGCSGCSVVRKKLAPVVALKGAE